MNARRTTTVSRRVDAPPEDVWHVLTDVGSWSRWAPLTEGRPAAPTASRHVRYGSLAMRVKVTSPDAPFWVRLQVTTAGGRFSHTGDVTLSPMPDGGTVLSWHATLTGGLPDVTGRRRARLEGAIAALAAALASYAEDPPTTRVDYWAQVRDAWPAAVALSA
jgi:hypothetical protein